VSYQVTYIEPAEREIERAFKWFSERSSVVGDRFLHRIAEVERRLAETPFIYAIARHDIHCAFLLPFRYGLYYRVLADEVVVIACLHTSRRPRLIGRILSTR
jgi:plasmid stabilization system protein ParE